MNPHTYRLIALTVLMAASRAMAQNYFDVMTMECNERGGTAKYKATVDFPVGGGDAVMKNAKEWIAEMLEADDDMVEKMAANSSADVFSKQLETVGKDFVASNPATNRTVEITWLYEDPSCVSYEAVTTDRDSVVWTTTDVACFSKLDGHRVQPEEIFQCDEEQIKKLMWKYRGDLEMEVARPADLYVGSCAFIDGWVIVIGPARNTSGAEYRLRYPEVEQWLVPSRTDGYLAK